MAYALLLCASLMAVDGDTIRCNGERMRDIGDGRPFVSGFDAPELSKPRCAQELAWAKAAKRRYAQLLRTPGVTVHDSGERDGTRTHRRLVVVRLPDGRSLGSILIQEGLAGEWRPGRRIDWCG